jgi:hypothetical protein
MGRDMFVIKTLPFALSETGSLWGVLNRELILSDIFERDHTSMNIIYLL